MRRALTPVEMTHLTIKKNTFSEEGDEEGGFTEKTKWRIEMSEDILQLALRRRLAPSTLT